jgi:hypothetical protein
MVKGRRMADQAPTYDELSIRIQPGGDGRYHVVASAPDGSTASGTFAPPFTETELDNFVLRVGRQRLGMRGYRSAQMEEAMQFGARLFEALMADGVRDIFRSARGVAESHQKGLRITLWLTDVPELMSVPWEFLYERPRFLAQSIYSPVVRSLDLGEVRSPHSVTLPLNVLGMVSRPQGFDTLDVEREKEKLARALAPLCRQQLVTLDWLERGTLRQLDEAISRLDEVHVFHYIGHGAYDGHADGGILVLENDRSEPHEVSGEELGSLLQDERSLRLAVLNSCEGARSSHVDPFSGVAASLVQYGIPAVIGMQFEITDEAAIAFAARLYTSLAEGYPVDAAVAQSRRSIFAAGNDIEFGTPVLFLRGADAHLFDLKNPAPQGVEIGIDPPPGGNGLDPPPDENLASSVPPPLPPPPPPPAAQPVQTPAEQFGWHIGRALRRSADRKRRISNRQIALCAGALVLIAAIMVAVFGNESPETGGPESVLATVIASAGFLGLIFVSFRAGYDGLLRLLRRFFDQ